MSAIKSSADTSDLFELKNVCDQQICAYLKKLGYKEAFLHQDVVLVLGYVGVIFCAIDFMFSYKEGFNNTIWFSYISVSVYALTSLLSYVYSKIYLAGAIFYGEKDGSSIKVSSRVVKSEEYYHLTVNTTKKDAPKSLAAEAKSSLSFGKYYYASGSLSKQALHDNIQSLLSTSSAALKNE
ncbi:hypothetical protein BB561_005586 [Smittium simulii]|uniref:Signal peptidase complex subunit 2 n=1 Tax=Smittium simulii TaxID=133385 RepID=A0A2T9Y9M5_9FUNG|nr:hypothetical protein BB561_005586 [Smittium simulii]